MHEILFRLKRTCKKNNYEKKEMIPLTKKEEKKHNKQKVCHICKKGFSTDHNNKKVRDHSLSLYW